MMNSLAYFQSEPFKKNLSRFGPAGLILLVMLLAYGWQITRLGFYWDDWVFVYRYQTLGVFRTMYYGDTRQLGVLALLPGFLFAGDSPVRWHIYILLLRWASVLIMMWGLNRLWPGHVTSVTIMALLFSVYPAFTQQSISVVYSVQFFSYALFLLSLTLTILAARNPRRFWPLTILAMVAQALHPMMIEYFFGLEFIRPLVLFFLQSGSNNVEKAKKALLGWLPYTLVMAGYVAWRVGLFGSSFNTYEYKTLPSLFRADPAGTLLDQSRYALQDIVQVVLTTWQSTVQPDLIDWAQPYNFFTFLISALVAGALFYILPRLRQADAHPDGDGFQFQAITLGLFTVLVGFLPAWFVTRHIIQPGYFGDRLALASMLGASMLVVGVIEFLANSQRRRDLLVFSILIGLAVGLQMRIANDYRWDWVRQSRTYWQTYWRAPALKEGTVLVGNGAISATTNNYTGIFAFSNLYGQYKIPASMWYVNYYKTSIPDNLGSFLAGTFTHADKITRVQFEVTPRNSLGIYYEAEGTRLVRCLKVLTGDELLTTEIPAEYRDAARFSDPGLILPEGPLPPAHIFGPEPPADWCMFFEKAELARQLGNWKQVISLKKEADRLGLSALTPYEYTPFIEAYGMSGEWDNALKLSLESYKDLKKTRDAVCLVWSRLGKNAPDHPGYLQALTLLNAQLACPAE
jgi:hypothetical protein